MDFATKRLTGTADVPLVVSKICAAAKNTIVRKDLKPHERTRIKEAFKVLIYPQKWVTAPRYQKKVNWDQYVEKLYQMGNAQLVMVCVLGVGIYFICCMKKRDREELLDKIICHRQEWDDPILQSLAQKCWTEGHITAFSIEICRLTKTVQETTESSVEPTSEVVVASVPVAMLERVLGNFVFTGMELSHTRREEGLQMLTSAVRLHLPIELEGDFTLEVCLLPSFGKCILDVAKLREESLRGLLGEYLFEAMKTSKYKKGEEMIARSLTSAVSIVDDSSGDKRLKVKTSYNMGLGIWGGMSAS